MSELPTPAVVPPGHVVRVRIPGQTYTSPVAPLGEAKARYAKLVDDVARAGGADRLVDFETVDGRVASIRARIIQAIEVGPPPPKRDERRPEIVHVHLYGAADDDIVSLLPKYAAASEFLAGPA